MQFDKPLYNSSLATSNEVIANQSDFVAGLRYQNLIFHDFFFTTCARHTLFMLARLSFANTSTLLYMSVLALHITFSILENVEHCGGEPATMATHGLHAEIMS